LDTGKISRAASLKNGHLGVRVDDTAAKVGASLKDACEELGAAPVSGELGWVVAKSRVAINHASFGYTVPGTTSQVDVVICKTGKACHLSRGVAVYGQVLVHLVPINRVVLGVLGFSRALVAAKAARIHKYTVHVV
jgi:hypothetical protein